MRKGLPVDEVEFGRYRLLSLIGEGGMGQVYRAHDTLMDRDVAIKVLPPELASNPGYEARFRREASTAARLNEPHIIPVFESGDIDGRLYLVMPIIEGVDVDALLRRDGPMTPPRAVHIVEQLAAALDAAHAVGLVHRDIKPSNALVTGRDFAYLIDFGIAHDAQSAKLTGTGMIVGTWAYMAPERLNLGVADVRTDVYALACLLHECLTGDLPYPGDSVQEQAVAHLTMDPPLTSACRPGVPVGFDDVTACGMAKDPEQRYQSAHQLATAARRALGTAPSRTPPSPFTRTEVMPAPTPAWRPPSPSPAPVRQPAMPNWAPPMPPRPIPPQPIPPQPQRRTGLIGAIVAAVVVLVAGAIGIAVFVNRSQPTAPRTASAYSAAPPPTTTNPAVAESALAGLLLTADQISAAMGVSGMALTATVTTMPGNGPARLSNQSCAALAAAGSSAVYADSGWTAVRGTEFKQPAAGPPLHDVAQFVVLFGSAKDAATFFTTSAQQWQGCSNQQFTISAPGSGYPDSVENVGPVSNTNGVLSATLTSAVTSGITCQRALTTASNVAVDVQTCNASPADAVAVSVAHQIATKALKTQ